MSTLPAPSEPPSVRTRPLVFVIVGAVIAVLLATLTMGAVFAPVGALAAPYQPTSADGYLREPVTLDDSSPAIRRLDPELRAALGKAADAAATAGVAIRITSGWRAPRLQQWLLDQAVKSYGSEQTALEWVATPDRSHHVSGAAVDVGPVGAQAWLSRYGAQWGLCQVYGNEAWHFELLTTPGGTCPPPRANAAD